MRGRRKFLGRLLGLLYSAEVFCRSPARREADVFQLRLPSANAGLPGTLDGAFPSAFPGASFRGGLPRWTARWRPSRRESTSVTDGGRVAGQPKLGVPNNWDPGSSACVVCGCAGFPSLTPAAHSAFYHAFHPRPLPAPYVG